MRECERKKSLRIKYNYSCHRHRAGVDSCSESALESSNQWGGGTFKFGRDNYKVLTWDKYQDCLLGKRIWMLCWQVRISAGEIGKQKIE